MRPPVDRDPGRLKVLDLGRFLAGPVAATILGDLGAEVIKVERPRGGDPARRVAPQPLDDPGMSYEFQIEGRNKRFVTLDLSTTKGQHLLRRLALWADVLVENFQPGVMDGWGLGYPELSAVNPSLVYLSVSGFGASGPYRDRPGFDFVAAAFAGLAGATGIAGGPPVLAGYAIADLVTAAFGAIGVLESIRRRDRPGSDGRGEWVDLGLYESVLRLATPWIPLYMREGVVRERESSLPRQDGRPPVVLWGYVYPTRDGRWVAMTPIQHDDRLHARVLALVGRVDLIEDQRFKTREARVHNYEQLDSVLREWAVTVDAAEALAALAAAGVPCGPVNSIADICDDPQVLERNLVTVPDHRGTPITMQGVVPRLSRDPGTVRWAGEELGASNDDVYGGLLELGADELTVLAAEGVI